MDSLVAGSLTIDVNDAAHGIIRLDWRGKSNDRQPSKVLSPYFGQIATEAVRRDAAIEMHFEQLEHFNSSTITSIIQLIQDLRQKKLRLSIYFAASLKWQKLGFDALRIFD